MEELSDSPTVRASSPALDKILGQEFPVGEYGFVKVIDYIGNDDTPAIAARTSTDKENKKPEANKNLINFLIRNAHTSPLEFNSITFECRMQMSIAEQVLRHRTGKYCKQSGRYSVMKERFYRPDQLRNQSKVNLQSSEGCHTRSEEFTERMEEQYAECYKLYCEMIESGVAKEQARFVLPASLYTTFYMKMDLHNLLKFLKLRLASDAQEEIRKYARVMADIVKLWVPNVYESFENYWLCSATLSKKSHKFLIENLTPEMLQELVKKCDESNLPRGDKIQLLEFLQK